eukprot:TRINITY_DN1065_c0_g1_i2.p1 TRINITY_DN1065_c0_g1~~TRINITY_DN1065_c0_g1_i2.p1  ORF type:complete len:308 (-),score=62.48 TRINITY_DN1065_c0_g1_i2:31-954(-)
MSLRGKVAVVTGASRGIGRGIALQLGGAGATVYITGRSANELNRTANDIKERGGNAIPVSLDHNNDAAVEQFFERIKADQKGILDVLVNNAYSGVGIISETKGKPFWECPGPEMWDKINGVGLRNHYLCTVYASRIMVENKSGLIINISSGGGLRYLFNVVYGIGKAACDRMAADCAVELKKKNVAMVSLWPGPVKTEEITERVLNNSNVTDKERRVFENGESTEFTGSAIVRLASDPKIMDSTGKILFTSALARKYGLTDVNGTITGEMFSIKNILLSQGNTWLATLVPEFIRIPPLFIHYLSNKF